MNEHETLVANYIGDRSVPKVEITRHLKVKLGMPFNKAQALLYGMVRQKMVVWNGDMGRGGRYRMSPDVATALPPLGGRARANGGRADPGEGGHAGAEDDAAGLDDVGGADDAEPDPQAAAIMLRAYKNSKRAVDKIPQDPEFTWLVEQGYLVVGVTKEGRDWLEYEA